MLKLVYTELLFFFWLRHAAKAVRYMLSHETRFGLSSSLQAALRFLLTPFLGAISPDFSLGQ
jgi:hypothetical protein